MKKRLLVIIAFLLMFTLVGCSKEEKPENPVTFDENFAVEFLKLENDTKNIIYSPLSIKYALNMTNEGAAGDTQKEISEAIKNLNLTKYSNIDKNLSLVNAIYIRDTYKNFIKESYTNTLSSKYDALVKYDAFANAKNINKFIEDSTLGIIKDMLDDQIVSDPNTEVILINALAINMEWNTQFGTYATNGADFIKEDGTKIKATTMHANEIKNKGVAYYQDDSITAISMDLKKYGDTQLEFIAIMPNSSLKDYVSNFKTAEIDNIKSKMTLSSATNDGVSIAIPKFKYDYKLNLKDDLMSLGIQKAFTEAADFTNMTSSPIGLYIRDALHKADIEFSESGIKAAAATAIVFADKSARVNNPVKIEINKPFLYVIRDKANGEIWFVGTMYEPNLWSNDKANY